MVIHSRLSRVERWWNGHDINGKRCAGNGIPRADKIPRSRIARVWFAGKVSVTNPRTCVRYCTGMSRYRNIPSAVYTGESSNSYDEAALTIIEVGEDVFCSTSRSSTVRGLDRRQCAARASGRRRVEIELRQVLCRNAPRVISRSGFGVSDRRRHLPPRAFASRSK